MAGPSYISYYAEPLPHGRAIMRCDIVVDGVLVQTYETGSPAPMASVKAAEDRVELRPPRAE